MSDRIMVIRGRSLHVGHPELRPLPFQRNISPWPIHCPSEKDVAGIRAISLSTDKIYHAYRPFAY